METKYIVIYTDESKKSDTIRHLMADSPSANRFVKEVFVEYGAVDSRLYAAQKVRPLDISGGFSVHQLGRRQDGNLEIRVQ